MGSWEDIETAETKKQGLKPLVTLCHTGAGMELENRSSAMGIILTVLRVTKGHNTLLHVTAGRTGSLTTLVSNGRESS